MAEPIGRKTGKMKGSAVWSISIVLLLGILGGALHFPHALSAESAASKGFEVSGDWLHEIILERVRAETPWHEEGFTLKVVHPKKGISLPRMPRSIKFLDPIKVEPGGIARGTLVFLDRRGSPISKAAFEVRANRPKRLWRLRRAVRKGQVFDLDNVQAEDVVRRRIPPGACEDPKDLVGMVAKRHLSAGALLRYDQWKALPMVKRMQQVQILLETPTLRMVASGLALEEGQRGQLIRVLNVHSKRVIMARVRDAGTTVVEYRSWENPVISRISEEQMR